jgi:hypothetical protein
MSNRNNYRIADMLQRLTVIAENPYKRIAELEAENAQLREQLAHEKDYLKAYVDRAGNLYTGAVWVCNAHKRGTYADDKDLNLLCKGLDDWESGYEEEEVARVRADRKAHEEAVAALREIAEYDTRDHYGYVNNDTRASSFVDIWSIAKRWLDMHP